MSSRPSKRQKTHHVSTTSTKKQPLKHAPDMDDIPFKPILITTKSYRPAENIREQHNEFLDESVRYTILYDKKPEGIKIWDSMKDFKRFRLQDEVDQPVECGVGDIIYVKCEDEGIDDYGDDGNHSTNTPIPSWVAQVLEIRAYDKFHVFLRVWWLNRPEDTEAGRQWYHGEDEVIPSTHMDIIDANTVNNRVHTLKKIDEHIDMDEVLNEEIELVWRQTYDIRTNSFSPLKRYCICDDYKNPNLPLLACENPKCGTWLHAECIKDDAAKRHYARATQTSSGKQSTPNEADARSITPLRSILSKLPFSSIGHSDSEQTDQDLDLTQIPLAKARKRFLVSIENMDSASFVKSKKETVMLKVKDGKQTRSEPSLEPVRCLKCRSTIK